MGLACRELKRLTPADVDLDQGFLTVHSTAANPTKTGASRFVPINPDLKPYLQDALDIARGASVLFSRNPDARPEDRLPLNRSSVLTHVETTARKLGLPAGQSQRGWTVHLFRHCLRSYAVNKAVPQRAVDVWFGHLGDASSSRQYYHLGPEDSLRLMQPITFPAPRTTVRMCLVSVFPFTPSPGGCQ